jgi:hypothetical protein
MPSQLTIARRCQLLEEKKEKLRCSVAEKQQENRDLLLRYVIGAVLLLVVMLQLGLQVTEQLYTHAKSACKHPFTVMITRNVMVCLTASL